MGRSLFRDVVLDGKGNALSGLQAAVYDHGTTTPISETIYKEASGAETLPNPFTIPRSTRGEVIFYIDISSKRVDVRYSGAGVTPETVTLDGVSPDDLVGGGGATDHGALTGLADDDHSQYTTTAEATALVTAHEGAANPHPTYETSAEVDTKITTHEGAVNPHPGYHTSAEVAADIATHEAAANPHPTYETSAEAQAKVDAHAAAGDPHPSYETSGEVDAKVATHEAAVNPHPTYHTSAEVAADIATHEAAANPHPTYETSAEVDTKISTHEGAANPHPTYHTAAEVAADIATHEAAMDPHPVYETSTEAQAKVDVHTTDSTDAHAASAITNTPAGTVAATTVQAAIDELATEYVAADAAHVAAGDPHPTYETSAEAAAKITTHEAAADPHPGYVTTAEGATLVSDHTAAADPHAVYQKESEKNAASGYQGLTATLGISLGGELEQEYLDDGDKTGATTIALTLGNVHRIRMTGNITLTVTGSTSGKASSLTLILVQDGTGSRLVTWPATTLWEGGAPVLSTAINAVDIVTLITVNGGTTWYGFLVGKGMA